MRNKMRRRVELGIDAIQDESTSVEKIIEAIRDGRLSAEGTTLTFSRNDGGKLCYDFKTSFFGGAKDIVLVTNLFEANP